MSSSPTTLPIDTRIQQAHLLWAQGCSAEAKGEWSQAYTLYTSAHDLVIDCAELHQQAHVHLRRVNLRLGHYGELMTDWALAMFTPLGVFRWVAYAQRKSGGWMHPACRRA